VSAISPKFMRRTHQCKRCGKWFFFAENLANHAKVGGPFCYPLSRPPGLPESTAQGEG
jgi:hypothetical protein